MERDYQREVLARLREAYPNRVSASELPPRDETSFGATLCYLDEHQLIDLRRAPTMGHPIAIVDARITAKGLDFLADDGGLSAILGVVTIKIDSDDLRALMVSRVEASDLPPEEKHRRIHAIRSFSASVLRDATVRWATEALVRLPDAVQLFQTGAGPS